MEKKENSAAKESCAKKSYVVYAIVVVLAIGALGAVFFGMQEPKEDKSVTASEFFFSSMDKMKDATEYALEFRENVSGIENKYVVVQAKSGRFASVENIVDRREFYVLDGGQYACERFLNYSVCAAMRENGSAESFFNTKLLSKFFGREQVKKDSEFLGMLEKFGAVEFADGQEAAVNGMKCRQMSYKLDYGKLSLNQLNQLGIAANSPLVTQFGDYEISLCIDEASGIAVRTVLSYKFAGERRSYVREYDSLKVGGVGELKAPIKLENVAKFEDVFAQASAELAVYSACGGLVESEAAKCYKGIALDRGDDGFCARISSSGEREKCYLMVGVQAAQPQTCEKAGGLRDDCLFEIGAGGKDASVCAKIGNASLAQECVGIAGNGTASRPVAPAPKPGKSECIADSDCAPTGCSNIVCAPLNASIATTCEYSPLFACYEKAFCGCREGACSWYKGEEYHACVADVEREGVKELIGQKIAEANANASNSSR